MDSFDLISLAVAVLLGNLMTLSLFKGWQRMKRENDFNWTTAFYWLTPLAMIVLVLYLNRDEGQATRYETEPARFLDAAVEPGPGG